MNIKTGKLYLIYKSLSTPEIDAKKIGAFRVICAVLGGFILSSLTMILLVYISPLPLTEMIVLPMLFNFLTWSMYALWISVSPSRFKALKRVIIPTIILSILVSILYFV